MRKPKSLSKVLILLSILIVTSSVIIFPDNNHAFIKLTPEVNHQILIVALFFINAIISIFIFMSFIINKRDTSVFLLGLAFFSGLVYFVETILIIQKATNKFTEIQDFSERIAIFYFFRQLNFVLILFLFVYAENNKLLLKTVSKDKFIIAGILITLSLPMITYYVCDTQHYLFLKKDILAKNELEWENTCIKSVIVLWLFLLLSVVLRKSKPQQKNYVYIFLLCFTTILCNAILLMLDEVVKYPVWFISRGIEVVVKLFIVSLMMLECLKKLKHSNTMIFNDELTSVHNRRYFIKKYHSLFEDDNIKNICTILIDIDYFKKINDTWGHKTGDNVIINTANIIKDNIRSDDTLARLGGEEFVILLYNLNVNTAAEIAERIRANVETQIKNTISVPVTISIGLCLLPKQECCQLDIISLADQALYKAKNSGRNKVCIYQ
ncbi:GGDEF domain-containing protein [Salmonella enterica]|nr:GGDEF domain-containing protein [Salmonella enterica]EBR8649557.1 GGDEF domain-containing protein [Salmonella enterica subsp. enterica serovar Muenchen]EBJ1787892.1 GGDEF domain-containing protein [Salmonella enterica]EBM3133801.1 GGDEF domain-containing protein [Salmonella enterica]ECS8394140.1 GGDEF domain-containing protein [Salmonella enterica subsp. enterica serovar Muenchen]